MNKKEPNICVKLCIHIELKDKKIFVPLLFLLNFISK